MKRLLRRLRPVRIDELLYEMPVEAALAAGRDVLFDIDWQGHLQLRERLPGDVEGVFLLPPDMAELERRLRARGQDGEAEIARRMADLGADVRALGPEPFKAWLANEAESWGRVVRANNIRPE